MAFLSGLAATLAVGVVSRTGNWAREKLGTPERQAALERCSLEGLQALVQAGIDREKETAEMRGHTEHVLQQFFGTRLFQVEIRRLLRGKEVTGADLAELFEDEQEAHQLPQFEPEAGFTAFLEAFEDAVVEEEAVREIVKTGTALERTRLMRKIAAHMERLPRAIEKARQAGEAKKHADQATTAEHAYLERMRREWQLLPLAALGGDQGPKEAVTLDDVYVALDTTTSVRVTENGGRQRLNPSETRLAELPIPGRTRRRLTALEAASDEHYLALLGDPGSGKSTFVRELLARFASARLGEGEVPEGFEEARLPVLVVLRDLSGRLSGLDLEGKSARDRERALAGAVREEAVGALERFGVGSFEAGLREAWAAGRCLVALDGLDEVPPARRALVREAVLAACRENGGPGRVIVTCRVRSYEGEARLPDFEAFTLAPFDEEKIRHFCLGWYRAQTEDQTRAEERGRDLARAALAESLEELASNPMLLTTMALVHQKNVTLPDQRVELYDEAVKVLLVRWQEEKDGPEGLEDFLTDDRRLRRMMERLAFEAHRVGGTEQEEAAGLPRGTCLKLLETREFLGDPGAAGRFLDYVDRRAGLLVGQGGGEGEHPESYSFPHRTFQEYLAGCHLIRGRDAAIKKEFFARAGEGDLWSVAAELGAEALLYVRDHQTGLLDLAYGLCPAGEPVTEQEQRAALWSGKAAAVVGREVIERDTEGPEPGKVYLKRLLPRLADLLASDLPPVERAEAGRALAVLGDPRAGVMTVLGMEMCRVPAGSFWWGGSEDLVTGLKDPWEKREVADPYWMSRFPVTQAQYREFAEAGGYREARYWEEAKVARVWERVREGPARYSGDFSYSNHPVVGVSWWEALAFTRWLTERLHEKGLSGDWAVQLPSGMEWEKAARGGVEVPVEDGAWESLDDLVRWDSGMDASHGELKANPSPGRKYPWGEEPTPDHANYDDTGIGSTSAVGAFPRGRSPYGCEELSGNVWEWSRDFREGEATDPRAVVVLRGGAWAVPARFLAAAFRNRFRARIRNRFIGFRVVLVRISEHA